MSIHTEDGDRDGRGPAATTSSSSTTTMDEGGGKAGSRDSASTIDLRTCAPGELSSWLLAHRFRVSAGRLVCNAYNITPLSLTHTLCYLFSRG